MARGGNQPRLLSAVMEAIANLKEGRGSTQKRIIDQVQCLLTANKMSLRNPTVHIKKALRHGVHTGLIKQKGGKFKLGLDSKDYAIFKEFQKMRKKDLPLKEHKRGRKRRKKSRRRRRRRRRRRSASSPDEDVTGSGSASDSVSGTPEPADRGRRRKKRRRRRRRGRKRTEEREWSSGHGSSENKEISPSISDENTRTHGRSERDRDRDRDRDREREREEDNCDEVRFGEKGNPDDPTCGDPECLCNLNQEMNS